MQLRRSLVAAALRVGSFTDVSCSAATTVHTRSAQPVTLGRNAPQFNALRDSTRLVTVGIGGNDVGLVGAALTCTRLGLLAPTGTACRSHFNAGGTDRIVARIAETAPKIAAVIDGIRERSPLARILVVGYPAVLPRSGNGCYPVVPFSPDDVRYFDGLIVATSAMLAEVSATNGAEFVDTDVDSVGHDVCTLPGTKWFEGLVPTATRVSLASQRARYAQHVALGPARPRRASSGTAAQQARSCPQDGRPRSARTVELSPGPRRDADCPPRAGRGRPAPRGRLCGARSRESQPAELPALRPGQDVRRHRSGR